MRYLRLLSNSLVAGALATSYVLVVVLQLNPGLPLDPRGLAPLAFTIGLFYAVHLTAIFYAMLVARRVFAREPFSPAWVSVGVIAWLGAAASAGGAAVMWGNLHTFAVVLEPQAVERMAMGAVVLSGSSALFMMVALARRYAGPGRPVLALSLCVVAATSVAGPAAWRGRGTLPPLQSRPLDVALDAATAERTSGVTMLAIDAGSLDFIANAAAEGRLSNFGRILDRGAVMHLATLHPTSAEAVWAAVATGKLPQKNGVRSAAIYRLGGSGESVQLLPEFCFATRLVTFGFLRQEPQSATAFRTRTLWSILSAQGMRVGVVNWPLTYPASVVRGYLVSDAYSRLALTPSGLDDPAMVYPPELRQEVRGVIADLASDLAPAPSAAFEHETEQRHRAAGTTDRVNDRLAETLARTHPPQAAIVRYQSLDPIGHYFLRYAVPSAFGDVTDEERRTLGSVLERHYALVDEAIGRALARLGPDDLLIVVSGYGMEPLGVGRRMLEWIIGNPEISGTHEGAPDGFLMAYGASVAKARSIGRASIVDVVPTVLYFLGLPIGRDMDGYARTDIFQSAFTEERPLTFIPTYDR